MAENLDGLVVWMTFLNRAQPRVSQGAMFHLIMSAYESTVIKDPLEFLDEPDEADVQTELVQVIGSSVYSQL